MDMVLGADVGGSVLSMISSVISDIRSLASTAKQNKEDCLAIASRATKLVITLSSLDTAAANQHPAVTSVLEDLHFALRRALEAVMGCQLGGFWAVIRSFINAGKASAELRLLNEIINDRIMDVVLVISVHTNSLVNNRGQHHTEHRELPLPLPQRQQIQRVYEYYAHNRSLSNHLHADIESSAATPEDVAFGREARQIQPNIEPRFVLLLIIVLVLLGLRCFLFR